MVDSLSTTLVLLVLLAIDGLLAAARAALVNVSKARLRQLKDEQTFGAALTLRPKKKKTKSLRLKLLAELRAKVKSTKLRVRDTKKELTQLQRDIKSLSCRKGLGTS